MTPAQRLNDARRAHAAAYERCPHWDHHDDGGGHDCCDDLADAKVRLASAKRAYLAAERKAVRA